VRILIAGGTGFLGTALSRALLSDGHRVSILTRGAGGQAIAGAADAIRWNPEDGGSGWREAVAAADAVVNLAGESIAAGRWTNERKRRILESRTVATAALASAIADSSRVPAVFVSGSAVGYYGPRQDEIVTEDCAPGSDFLASVCQAWEAAAAPAIPRTRVVTIRTGLPLSKDGGALPKMLPPFWFGAGGPVGSGRQYWPWIHVHDWVNAVRFLLTNDRAAGPVNLTAPGPVTNAAFAAALGRAMHRPALLKTPAVALRLLLGEMADALLLSGQRVVPDQIRRLGYTFAFDSIDAALRDLFG
jgi:uncharacterized protein (TIGR01777 family)